MARVVAIGSGKGGVGKSKLNLAVACALALRKERPRVLLVDACQDQGMLSYMFAAQHDVDGRGLGQMIDGVLTGKSDAWVVDAYRGCRTEIGVGAEGGVKIDFLPAASEVLGDITITNRWIEKSRGDLMGGVLDAIDNAFGYDYIVVDTVPLLRIHTTASVMALADAYAVALDVQNIENIAGIDRYIAFTRGLGANLAGIVQNLYDSKFQASKLAKEFVDTVCRSSSVPVIVTVPRSASVSNTSTVFDDEDGLSVGAYVLLEKDKTQRRHLEVVIQRFETIANALVEACDGTKSA